MPTLKVRVDGSKGSGKTTLTGILYNLLRDGGYDVCLDGDAFQNQLVETTTLRGLPLTYLRTKVILIDNDSLETVRNPHASILVLTALMLLALVLAVFVESSVPYILTAMVSATLAILVYRAVFIR